MLLKENSIRKEKLIKGKNRYYLYIFECDGCGKELKIQGSSLKNHSGKCMRCTQLKEPYMYIYNELKSHKKENIEFNLTFEEFLSIIQNNNCHYCNDMIKYEKYSRVWGKTNSRAHQLDRKDNNLGYIKDNLVTCCWDCNRLKSNKFTYEEFLSFSPILTKIKLDRKEKI